jgi:hypothetical protein
MTLSEIKKILATADTVNFKLEDGSFVPEHFHVTEVGQITKHFIDCGGNVRNEAVANFQLWDANDYDHRLKPQKLIKIIELSEKVLGLEDHEIEVEYQNGTIGKFGLDFDGKDFILTNKKTACLASDNCGSQPKQKVSLQELSTSSTEASCTPGGGCC